MACGFLEAQAALLRVGLLLPAGTGCGAMQELQAARAAFVEAAEGCGACLRVQQLAAFGAAPEVHHAETPSAAKISWTDFDGPRRP